VLRLIALVALFILFWIALTALLNAARRVAAPPRSGRPPAAPPGAGRTAERLVACARCGVRVPESRALVAARGGPVFCSPECRDAGGGP
jgi:hypothetical protein